MSGEVIVDALPYYDTGYDDVGIREAAIALVEEETRRYRPTKNYLDIIPPANYTSYETKLMRTEFERIQGRLPQEPLIMKRYELPGPSSGRMNDLTAWKDCVNNSRSQLEHQVIRIENLQLLSKFGPEAWKMYTEELTRIYEVAAKKEMEIRKDIQNINWNRKNEQTAAGSQLKDLENRLQNALDSWVSLVTKNYEIEQACVDLKRRPRRKAENQDDVKKQLENGHKDDNAARLAHLKDAERDALYNGVAGEGRGGIRGGDEANQQDFAQSSDAVQDVEMLEQVDVTPGEQLSDAPPEKKIKVDE